MKVPASKKTSLGFTCLVGLLLFGSRNIFLELKLNQTQAKRVDEAKRKKKKRLKYPAGQPQDCLHAS